MKHSKNMVPTPKANPLEVLRRFLTDKDGSVSKKALFLIGALYILSPVDIIPEILVGPLGLTDDAAALFALFRTYQDAASVYQHQAPGKKSSDGGKNTQ